MAKTKSKPKPKPKAKSSATDRHAKVLAVALGKGQLPPLTAEMDQYLDECPHEIFAAFEGVVRHMPPAGKNEPLAVGYLFLLQGLLERLRFRSDRGHAGAIELIAKFQAEVAARALAGDIDGDVLAYVGGALEQAKIPASPELIAASAELGLGDDDDMLPADVVAALDGMLDNSGDDPFALVGLFMQAGHTLPEEAQSAVALSLAGTERPEGRAAAVLFLLDPSAAVRRAAVGALGEVATALSPADLRRLIAMRNWRPENERAAIDAVIHKARAAGIACAPWEKGTAETIRATAIDGAAAQALMLLSPAGRKKRLSSVLIKAGIADAWSAEPQSQRQIELRMDASGANAPMLEVSRLYLDRMVSHGLALTIAVGETPPPGLLEVAETIGGADWQPALIDYREELAGLIADLPDDLLGPEDVGIALADSDGLLDLEEIERAWFEDDAELAQAVADAADQDDEMVVTSLLQGVLAQRRDKWAELFVRTALWMRQGQYPSWAELALVARALWEGRDLAEIGLMRSIAERTVAVLAEEEDMEEQDVEEDI